MRLDWSIAQRFRRYRASGDGPAQGFLSFISASSTLGIALGCTVFIAALSVMNGFSQLLENRFLQLIPHIEITAVDGELDDVLALVEQVTAHPQVKTARPVIKSQAMVQQGSDFVGMQLQGVALNQSQPIEQYTDAESWQKLTQPRQVIIGRGLAAKLEVDRGDTLTLLVAEQNSFRQPRRIQVQVAGTFTFGGQVDHQLAYTSLATARELAGLEQTAAAVEISVRDIYAAQSVAYELGQSIREHVYLDHWMRAQGHLYRDIQLVRLVMYVVLSLVLAVACFNIVSTLIMTVQDKQQQVGILRTMGMRASTVQRMFIWHGLLNGLWGIVFGILGGLTLTASLPALFAGWQSLTGESLLASDVYFVAEIPVALQGQDVLIVTAVALLMSLLATLYPAWRAARLEIVQSLD
ncbi:lipoprotein-releasing system transmembrane subunit, LolC/LolE family [Pseudidiomarina aestuarii]|uniref:Lipoprotein-releasing system transmembrane subunit, LolC/LolE family n=1 Tax=Pseudidiomarina aestuarii TaxID=624146 RepID=A0A7Z6ZT60_9GAMM|nr:lipoprotein-releasing ABC transporter permease subunit [Pseudidiomarina aestuarii]RUO40833.1 lipoprotein-releasing system transmembrane subunit, LolC/LolE family [Pseudidiomarina aestuarii]